MLHWWHLRYVRGQGRQLQRNRGWKMSSINLQGLQWLTIFCNYLFRNKNREMWLFFSNDLTQRKNLSKIVSCFRVFVPHAMKLTFKSALSASIFVLQSRTRLGDFGSFSCIRHGFFRCKRADEFMIVSWLNYRRKLTHLLLYLDC